MITTRIDGPEVPLRARFATLPSGMVLVRSIRLLLRSGSDSIHRRHGCHPLTHPWREGHIGMLVLITVTSPLLASFFLRAVALSVLAYPIKKLAAI